MKKKLQSLIVCPVCKGQLVYQSRRRELVCKTDRLAFPVRHGVPVLLLSDARHLSE